MSAFLSALLFPVLAGLGFGIVHAGFAVLFGMRSGRLLVRHGGWIYLTFLLPVLILAWREAARHDALATLGLRLPERSLLLLALPLALLLGRALFLGELVLSSALARVLPAGNPLVEVVEGRSRQLSEHAPGALAYLSCSAAIVAAEEFLWRGFLPYFMTTRLEVSWPVAIAVSALTFGLNHAYYGLRNVLLKALDGAAWTLLALGFASLLPAALSHGTFQFFVWRRLRRLSARA